MAAEAEAAREARAKVMNDYFYYYPYPSICKLLPPSTSGFLLRLIPKGYPYHYIAASEAKNAKSIPHSDNVMTEALILLSPPRRRWMGLFSAYGYSYLRNRLMASSCVRLHCGHQTAVIKERRGFSL